MYYLFEKKKKNRFLKQIPDQEHRGSTVPSGALPRGVALSEAALWPLPPASSPQSRVRVPLGQCLVTAGRPCRRPWPRARGAAAPRGSPPAASGFWGVGVGRQEERDMQLASGTPWSHAPPHPLTSEPSSAGACWLPGWQGSASV